MKLKSKQDRFDKRLHFVATVLNLKLTENAQLANSWYINNNASAIANDEALQKFKEWI